MQLKQILLKATKGRTNCSRKGCPIYDYDIDLDNCNLHEMYKYLTGEDISLDNCLSFCSEYFLSLCYEYNKKLAKKMFDKYVFYGGSNFFKDSTNKMPCKLLGEMAKFMLKNEKKSIDIE